MAQTAFNEKELKVYSWDVEDNKAKYRCCDCKEPLIFVNGQRIAKHFRHKVEAGCNPEPETYEHYSSKELLFKKIQALNNGTPDIEHPIGTMKADVFWERIRPFKVAFEIQSSNYSPEKYEAKINYYALKKNLIVVYLFVGKNFLNEIRTNIYSLKEIEKRILVEKKYLDTVIGGYLQGDSVYRPFFKPKHAKGRAGFNENLFIIDYKKNPKRQPLSEFLSELSAYIPKNKYIPICSHDNRYHVKECGKLIRYQIRCSACDKFFGYLPNTEALRIGYNLERE